MYTNNNEYIFKVMKCLIFVDCKCATAKEKQSKAKKNVWKATLIICYGYSRDFFIGIFTAINHFNFHVKLHAFFEQM